MVTFFKCVGGRGGGVGTVFVFATDKTVETER